MISHKYFHLVSFFAIASFCISCSNKNAGIDERGFAVGEAPKQRLELKSTLGYQNYSNYVVTANVYKDNQLHKDCFVIKDDYCGKLLGYRYCTVWTGNTEPDPKSLDDMILPSLMVKTAQKFPHSQICDDELFSIPLLGNHLRLMQQFNHDLFKSIVLTNNTLISNADVLTHGRSESKYYNSVSCYGKAQSAFIKHSDYEQAGLDGYRYYVQLRGADAGTDGYVIYEIEEKLSTYYTLSGYDCRAIKGHKLTPTTDMFKGYSYADIENLMASRLNYCKSMCKSYDEEGKANGWATEPDASVTPISLDDVSAEPPKVFVNANIKTETSNTQNVPTPSVQIPELIPAPAVTNPPETRLQFKRSIKNKKGKLEYLIFEDTQLNTPCYVSLLDNQDVLTNTHYCIPYSGMDTQLKHPLDPTKTATTLENYKFCDNHISIEKRNIPGLAGFFKAFTPDYYQSHLKRFLDEPFQIHKPVSRQRKSHEIYYHSNYEDSCACDGPSNEGCALQNPFITEAEYQKYHLKPGDIFLTASAAKGEKVLHQYWQILTGTPETICYEYGGPDGYVDDYFEEKIVQVRDLSSKDTYVELMPRLSTAMSTRSSYCKAVNNTLINEARAGNWALIEAGSPLLKK